MTEQVTILGATGSIGRNTLDVISRHPERFQVWGLSAQSRVEKLAGIAVESGATVVSIGAGRTREFRCALNGQQTDIRVVEGDSVKVIRGEFNGVDGKVTKVSTANNGLTIEGVKKEKLKGDKYNIYIHTSNIEVTGLNTDDKWRINKLEGKNVRAARPKSEKKETISGKKLKSEKNEIKR